MAKHEIQISSLHEMKSVFGKYIEKFSAMEKFKPVKIVIRTLQRDKTTPQHRYYWVCIGELKKALKQVSGYQWNQERISEFIKQEAGFTDMWTLPNGKELLVTKSIADESPDATLENMKELIDFIIRFAQEHLDYKIQNPMEYLNGPTHEKN